MDVGTVLLTIGTSLLGGGLASALVTAFFSSRREERAILRGKLEELHTEFDRVARIYKRFHRTLNNYAQRKIELDEFIDRLEEAVDELPEPTMERIDAISAIYFPDFRLIYKSYRVTGNKILQLMDDVDLVVSMTDEYRGDVKDSFEHLDEMEALARRSILQSAEAINRVRLW